MCISAFGSGLCSADTLALTSGSLDGSTSLPAFSKNRQKRQVSCAHRTEPSVNVSPVEQSMPNVATMSPAPASMMSSISELCMRTSRGTCSYIVRFVVYPHMLL